MTISPKGLSLTVNVTQFYIDNGDPCKSNRCPVALAVMDAITDVKVTSMGFILRRPSRNVEYWVSAVSVDPYWIFATIHVNDDKFILQCATPPEVGEFIAAFDNNSFDVMEKMPIEPFSFDAQINIRALDHNNVAIGY